MSEKTEEAKKRFLVNSSNPTSAASVLLLDTYESSNTNLSIRSIREEDENNDASETAPGGNTSLLTCVLSLTNSAVGAGILGRCV